MSDQEIKLKEISIKITYVDGIGNVSGKIKFSRGNNTIDVKMPHGWVDDLFIHCEQMIVDAKNSLGEKE